MTIEEIASEEKKIKIFKRLRLLMWVLAGAVTVYWIYWSFKLFDMGIFDPYEYADAFRPVFARSLAAALICLGISWVFRRIQDACAGRIKHSRESVQE